MNSEEWQQHRLLCIAQMAAWLEAGDRARSGDEVQHVSDYVERATQLFQAVDDHEAALAEARYDEIHPLDR